jgi:hypothetical protein
LSGRRWLYLHPQPVNVIHDYWRKPDKVNDPKLYLMGRERSIFLVEILRRYVSTGASLLELGAMSAET